MMTTDNRPRTEAGGTGLVDDAARVAPAPAASPPAQPQYPPYEGYAPVSPPPAPVAPPVGRPAIPRREHRPGVWGVLLIVAGGLILLQNFDMLPTVRGLFWAAVFAAAGLAFLWRFASDTTGSWWAVIPGFTMLALGALVGIASTNVPGNDSAWLGSLFLGAIGLSFAVVYAVRRDLWWAIIPGGTMLTLAVVAGLGAAGSAGLLAGAVFFWGLALTFAAVAFLPVGPAGAPRMTWALIPAGVLALMGFMISLSWEFAAGYFWSVVLILTGLYLLYRHYNNGSAPRR